MMQFSDIAELALNSRRDALNAVHKAKAAHIGSSLSMIDIAATLFGAVANISPENVSSPNRDSVIVSKGHAAAGTYAVMVNVGLIPREWLDEYCVNGSKLGGHVTSHGIPGVDLSTGSLGHGLPYSVGMAIAAKRMNRPDHSFVLMSDGECDEGTTWESALLAGHHNLNNLTVAVDRNRLQSLRDTEDTLKLEPFADKWRAFGWDVHVVDGHDYEQLKTSLTPTKGSTKPKVVICETTKGKGVSFMENEVVWHYRPPGDDALVEALEELGRK